MYERFTERARKVMSLSREEAQRFNSVYIGSEHILLGLIREGSGVAANVLKNMDLSLDNIRLEVEKSAKLSENLQTKQLPFTPRAKKVLESSLEEANNLGHNYIGTEHLLLGLIKQQESTAAQILGYLGVQLEEVEKEVLEFLSIEEDEEIKTPALDHFTQYSTNINNRGAVNYFIGRDCELQQMQEILICRENRNPLIVGEIGVGKTTIVHQLAHSMPDYLFLGLNCEILMQDINSPGQLEERLKAILAEVRKSENIILVIDDIHNLAFCHKDGGIKAFDIIKLDLRKAIRCIGITTRKNYFLYIKSDKTLDARFQPVIVQPLPNKDILLILKKTRKKYEQYYDIEIRDCALTKIVEIADQLETEREKPTRNIDMLDQCIANILSKVTGFSIYGENKTQWWQKDTKFVLDSKSVANFFDRVL
ncbi:Clp protease N-terminal domain-containing protein [Candidatus Uabimicrobium sp. HlEnr_7]|uniref:Clp protease N-terminal domain-containing protein n=1 Tax=Candidatus Uabimicrobium helgolandensis TaxID=3095367 RepID=UPI003557EB2B